MSRASAERDEVDRGRGIALPVYCECGCGAVTNERQREAQRLRANGWTNVDIAEEWMMAPGSVKALLRRTPSRYLRGHFGATLRGEGAYEQACERCGNVMYRASPTRYCGRLACTATGSHATAWLARGIVEHVDQKREARSRALREWYQARRVRAEATARRRRRRSPEFLRHIERERQAFRTMTEEAAYAWLSEQSLEVREFVEHGDDPRLSFLSLDAAFSATNDTTRYDRLPGSGFNPRDVEWFDPVGDAVVARAVLDDSDEWDLLDLGGVA